jgi:hypothetical protein
MSNTITIEGTFSILPSRLNRAIHIADQLMYARQREWSGFWTMDRYKLRNLIADEMVKFAAAEAAEDDAR